MRQVIYHGGPILTMEAGPAPEALLAAGDTIAALGPLDDLRARAPEAELRDLEGKALLPAFLDPHSHLTALASTLDLCPLGAADSFAGLLDALADFARNHQEGWLMGFGYDPCVLAERAHPTRQVLDQRFPDRPVLLTHASGHMGVLNSAALALCGIMADSPDPPGGKIGREADGRTPSGYLEENAFRAACAQAPALGADPVDLLRRGPGGLPLPGHHPDPRRPHRGAGVPDALRCRGGRGPHRPCGGLCGPGPPGGPDRLPPLAAGAGQPKAGGL